jgi:hypothetical protein
LRLCVFASLVQNPDYAERYDRMFGKAFVEELQQHNFAAVITQLEQPAVLVLAPDVRRSPGLSLPPTGKAVPFTLATVCISASSVAGSFAVSWAIAADTQPQKQK